MKVKKTIVSLLLPLAVTVAQAQITIGGSVYGGGNAGDTGGNTTVTVRAGDLNDIYGGARMADVGGRTFVNIDGKHASADILIKTVYGGNDISGTIGRSTDVVTTVPEELENFKEDANSTDNVIKNNWKTFVLTTPCSSKKTVTIDEEDLSVDDKLLVIGSLYGGGNGDYTYKNLNGTDLKDDDGNYIVRDGDNNIVATSKSAFNKPELSMTYLELKGGCIAHVYGGGNNATVTENTTITIDNTSDDLQKAATVWAIVNNKSFSEVFAYLQTKVKLSTNQSNLASYAFNFARVFGGNNKAAMDIRPKWNLKKGIIRDLYSGGNEGKMTYKNGIFLKLNSADLTVENVYGGCRRADVDPSAKNITEENFKVDGIDYTFPAGYAARILITAGNINTVYGGNDISGTVKFGNAVGIHSNIKGDVYGGGNGSYVYTDNADLADDPDYGDFYYDPTTKGSSVLSLNAFRPNAESVSIHINSDDPDIPTVISGSVYCGGNSATLDITEGDTSKKAELKLGKNVIADKVFLGCNGEHMIEQAILQKYNTGYKDGKKISTLNLTDDDTFANYMKGVEVSILPTVAFDDDVDYNTYIGSYYCGGNVGSMSADGKITLNFNKPIVVYDKVVGGCNNANVNKTSDNAAYPGGLIGDPDTDENKLELTFAGLKIQPRRWDSTYALLANDEDFVVGNTYYTSALGDGEFVATTTTEKETGVSYYKMTDQGTDLIWNTYSSSTGLRIKPEGLTPGGSQSEDLDRRFRGGNIYGGCYTSGHVNGNVIININSSIIDRKGDNAIFDQVQLDVDEGEAILYDRNGDKEYQITERKSGVLLDEQGMDVLGKALNVFGGGYGYESEIWGSTTINLNAGYVFQIFGGGEQGAIGKPNTSNSGDYTFNYIDNKEEKTKYYNYNPAYSCTINLNGNNPGTYRGDTYTDDNDDVVDHDNMAEAEFIYGGGFFGPIAGNTQINLGNGRIFNSFAGSCNADILGHTETYVGRRINSDLEEFQGFPWIRDHIYGGNDLGGRILGYGRNGETLTKGGADFASRVSNTASGKVYNENCTKASAYTEFIQGRVDYIFGGCYGVYDYKKPHYKDYTYSEGEANIPSGSAPGTARVGTGFIKPRMDNAFINFKPNTNSRNKVNRIYGAGQGFSQDSDRDLMQDRSYILIDIPQTVETYANVEVFGAGDFSGVGMGVTASNAQTNTSGVAGAAVIDLVRGTLKAVYGASYNEGVTRRTFVNVPNGSTIKVESLFGGGFGVTNTYPCDAYEATVNYHSKDARTKAIYGGNNSYRRTLYGKVNISVPVWQSEEGGYTANVYGAGYGTNTWSQYTEVNLTGTANVYYAYGGGRDGKVRNWQTAAKAAKENGWDITIGKNYPQDEGLASYIVKPNGFSSPFVNIDGLQTTTNTNVYINRGANVGNYAFAGGEGGDASVSGSTYIGVHGGSVKKDVYAGGYGGPVAVEYDLSEDDDLKDYVFTATANAYIEGGTMRKCYGGGFEGPVGYHDTSTTSDANDIPGVANVVIGIREDQSGIDPSQLNFYYGKPAVKWVAYGGGEGGSIYGTANITLNNGYIGYEHFDDTPTGSYPYIQDGNDYYQEKHDDETYYVGTEWKGAGRLSDYGNLFGAGYDDKSTVDYTNVYMYGGIVRNSVYGGGELATIGRGKMAIESGEANSVRELEAIYKAGKAHIEIYKGHVKGDVFGGGKGFNLLDYGRKHQYYTDGYVFGETEVYIRGGEIGTEEGVSDGNGNVFGGGNIGFVYSGFGTKSNTETGSPNHYYYYKKIDEIRYKCKTPYTGHDENEVIGVDAYEALPSEEKGNWEQTTVKIDKMTEDCRVVIEPYAQVNNSAGVTIGNKTYSQYEYVPTDELNKLGDKNSDDRWNNLDISGILIRNGVFAGGNVASGSDKVYANAVTVFGNVTASLRDVFNRDLVTIGTEHVGGLYGGGNLSLVDGYRELNISNYGTDYYGLQEEIPIEKYNSLTDRERAYFKLLYTCKEENNGYQVGKQIDQETYDGLDSNFKDVRYWEPAGFCTIYAGRLLNTLQRADFVGVFGSRMVLQGARDRVTTVVDYNDYTINRVGELSLNQERWSVDPSVNHGNYFGIYNVVNYLGNLTSDVHLDDKRETDPNSYEANSPNETYEEFKLENLNNRTRNNGKSFNKVALASGVFLELTTEHSTGTTIDEKDWGLVTGVVELDLINVVTGEGGGYVYARNEHRVRSTNTANTNDVLSEHNLDARTYKQYSYSGDHSGDIETSGNFVHNVKNEPIIDDCYPRNGDHSSPAHYWYIKGEIYVYDQTISAYTGSATAYAEKVNIPLNITAASNGKLKLLNIQPNLYAYYDENGQKIGPDGMKVNGKTYHLNDAITYWDYSLLGSIYKSRFVPDTWVCVANGTINGTTYMKDDVVLPPDTTVVDKGTLDDGSECYWKDILRPSNNLSHTNGFLLTVNMDNPMVWNSWYTKKSGSNDKVNYYKYNEDETFTDQDSYFEGPTFSLSTSGVYGQRNYIKGDIIPGNIVSNYNAIPEGSKPTGGATVVRAYVATEDVDCTISGSPKHIVKGGDISETDYLGFDADTKAKFTPAFVCTSTITVDEANNIFLLNNSVLSQADINTWKAAYIDKNPTLASGADDLFNKCITEAYVCTSSGKYGGSYFSNADNHKAIDSWCTLALSDRNGKFSFNQDAFDILLDEDFGGSTYQANIADYGTPYSDVVSIDYTAVYNGSETGTYNGVTLSHGNTYTRDQYESLPNDQGYYSSFIAKANSGTQTYYIIRKTFYVGDKAYMAGTLLNESEYSSLSSYNDNIGQVTITNDGTSDVTYYYCREDYTISSYQTEAITDAIGTTNYKETGTVPKDAVISAGTYENIVNKQQDFTITGTAPIETSTLYVNRESDILNLSKDRIYTLVFQYTYDEDGDGRVNQISELHVLNICVSFESGVPEIGELAPPPIILPGTTVKMTQPGVKEGAYQIMGGGWEIFPSSDDAALHRNGTEFIAEDTPFYWYQNNKFYVSYYASSYLGKTYSNAVPLSVANYHDLAAVMDDKAHHYYVDQSPVDRDCKIYINDYSDREDGKDGLDLLNDFVNLSYKNTSAPTGHADLDDYVRGADNLEFILRTDIDHTNAWTSIANNTGECFEGTLHGDGHTISGLTSSLFNNLCGNVYNLGVTGSFTTAGIADEGSGYMENCWVKSSATTSSAEDKPYPVFGNPNRAKDNDADPAPVQLVNCYYHADNADLYNTGTNTRGSARMMSETEFYNGTVAYNLNGFFLNTRYYLGKGQASGISYDYLVPDADGNLPDNPSTGYYPTDVEAKYGNIEYVVNRFSDGDYIYADGKIPETVNIRMRMVPKTVDDGNGGTTTITKTVYAPIWPDDFIFFGQTLSYGFFSLRPHQNQPSHIAKTDDRIVLNESGNRVYRAPAYYGSGTMEMAHFNPAAILTAKSAPLTLTDTNLKDVYPGMTAVDFAGHNDKLNGSSSYFQGWQGERFYTPLLDDNGLTSINFDGQTPNLLVYAPTEAANKNTYDVLNEYFNDHEPVFEDYDEETSALYTDGKKYGRVAVATTGGILGHLVQGTLTDDGKPIATNDHMLVDKRDFNCPISYKFDDSHRMWYQRTPNNYVDRTKGWEGISIPFKAEIVTTQMKGELTHFYKKENSTVFNQNYDSGHEYWLRKYAGNVEQKKDDNGDNVDGVFTADFNAPAENSSDGTKTIKNSFLWDYYYYEMNAPHQEDANNDIYLKYQTYYKPDDSGVVNTFENYPRQASGMPYIIGFPGITYYEFDLSGRWAPDNTASPNPEETSTQVITFASVTGASIGVSDTELAAGTTSASSNYTFTPNYMSNSIAAGAFFLNDDGSSYTKTTAATDAVPFRPYFTATAPAREVTRSIVFSNDRSELKGVEEHGNPSDEEAGGLNIYAKKHKIVVESALNYTTDVRIVNTAGMTIKTFTIEPGETVETRIYNAGVYIVQTNDTRYTKKLAVR